MTFASRLVADLDELLNLIKLEVLARRADGDRRPQAILAAEVAIDARVPDFAACSQRIVAMLAARRRAQQP